MPAPSKRAQSSVRKVDVLFTVTLSFAEQLVVDERVEANGL